MPFSDEKDENGKRLPLPEDRRINHKDHFELAYMRWRYFMRSPNPDPKLLKKFEPLVRKVSQQAFGRFRPLFRAAGMDVSDIENVARVQLVSYLGLFSIEHNINNLKKYEQDVINRLGRAPTTQEIQDKDLSNMAAFISQRLLDMSRVCQQKNKRMVGEQFTYAMFRLVGKENPKATDYDLMIDPKPHGYKRLSQDELVKVKRSVKRRMTASERFIVGGETYRLVYETRPRINLEGIEGYEDMIFVSSQDQDSQSKLEEFESRSQLEALQDKFKNLSKKGKKRFLTKAIQKLEKMRGSEEELKLAKKMLARLR
jgi:hypothetical protein